MKILYSQWPIGPFSREMVVLPFQKMGQLSLFKIVLNTVKILKEKNIVIHIYIYAYTVREKSIRPPDNCDLNLTKASKNSIYVIIFAYDPKQGKSKQN